MFTSAVLAHSLLRWVVLAMGVVAVCRAVRGLLRREPWTSADTAFSFGFVAALDGQLLIGVVLFAFSPITNLGIHELDLALESRVLRFFTFEHPMLMAVSIVLAHIAGVRIWRHTEPTARHRTATVFFGLALLVLLAGIPWSFGPYERALLSLFQ